MVVAKDYFTNSLFTEEEKLFTKESLNKGKYMNISAMLKRGNDVTASTKLLYQSSNKGAEFKLVSIQKRALN